MNILEVASSGTIGSEHMGPIADTIFNLSMEFNASGNKVTISDYHSTHKRYKIHKDIRLVQIKIPIIFQIKKIKIINSILYQLKEFIYIFKLVHTIDSSKFDIIHTHETWTAFLIKLLIRKKNIVYTSHTSVWCSHFYKERFKGKIFSLFLKSIGAHEQQIIKSYPLTIGIGHYLKKIQNANIKVIPNGITYNHQNRNKNKAKNNIGIDSNKFLITTVARISPIKGLDTLVDAIKKIHYDHGKIKVHIIGSLSGSFGDSKTISSYAKKLIKKSNQLPIDFLGFISNQSKYFSLLLEASDIFILPSLFEPQGKVILEAMAHGVPVIVSDSGGMPEMVTHNTGFIFKPGDSEQLSKIIFSIINRKDILKGMGSNCQQHVAKRYNWELIARKHIKYFDELIIV